MTAQATLFTATLVVVTCADGRPTVQLPIERATDVNCITVSGIRAIAHGLLSVE